MPWPGVGWPLLFAPGSPGAQPWKEAPTLEPHVPVPETHPNGLPPSHPRQQPGLEQRSLGLTVLGGGRTHTYSQCSGDGGRGSAKEGGACHPKGRDPPTPTVPSPAPILGGWVDRQTDRVRHHRKAAPSTVQGCQSLALWSMRGGNYGARERQDSTCVRVCVLGVGGQYRGCTMVEASKASF